MKLYNYLFTFVIAGAALLSACSKDNKEEPGSTLSGKVVYQGQPVGVRSNGVQLELWQRGYQLFTKIPVYIAQDGSYSAQLFDGNYKLVRLKGNGPWADAADSIDVKVSGNTVVDVPVDPYFIIKASAFQKSGTNITGTVTLQRVNTTRTLEAVRLYVGQTVIVDLNNSAGNTSVAASAIPDATQPITVTVAIPAALASKDYLYARAGVKTTGVTELAYGTPIKIALK